MTEDLVKRLREPYEQRQSRRVMEEFYAADRIEELEAKLKTTEEIGKAFEEDAGQLRAKLAKAVEALRCAKDYVDDASTGALRPCGEANEDVAAMAKDDLAMIEATLAELTGGKDD